MATRSGVISYARQCMFFALIFLAVLCAPFTVCVPDMSTPRVSTTETPINTTTHRPGVTTPTSAASVPGCLLIHRVKLP